MENKSVINRTLVVASGAFAPGHLGELTQLVPFEMVDEALQQRPRPGKWCLRRSPVIGDY
ncbi:hypothetical protein FH608_023785 [Nonomuraea phyllanthi]|uniref:Uncharacterized protein n=1 Tax=Nonomuraea phyllanthi TaxID=2219224 RepID=A0A5C4W9I1_9ACTN|nr:hypothetical protein FH608_023785 [Nonomuraea phyllanthi]